MGNIYDYLISTQTLPIVSIYLTSTSNNPIICVSISLHFRDKETHRTKCLSSLPKVALLVKRESAVTFSQPDPRLQVFNQ